VIGFLQQTVVPSLTKRQLAQRKRRENEKRQRRLSEKDISRNDLSSSIDPPPSMTANVQRKHRQKKRISSMAHPEVCRLFVQYNVSVNLTPFFQLTSLSDRFRSKAQVSQTRRRQRERRVALSRSVTNAFPDLNVVGLPLARRPYTEPVHALS
jgi:hypothetical protein